VPSSPATKALEAANHAYLVRTYTLPHAYEGSYGEAVARALDVDPDRFFKTLVTRVDETPTVAGVPVSAKLSLKKLAAASHGKKAVMADPADAERWTGYVTGGISPFGQRRPLPMFVDETVILHDTVFASGGQRGLQIEFSPDLFTVHLHATTTDLTE
jgi:Cys-tRNA(Pro)/Cys-tRNA(Cys) deacylase